MKKFPPLASLFALGSADAALLDHLEHQLRASRRYDDVWRPSRWCLAARKALIGSEPDHASLMLHGFAFAEGRSAVFGAGPPPEDALAQLRNDLDRGGHRLERWPGDFGFLHFHTNGALSAVRSCAGGVPFYFLPGRNCVAIATECDALLRFAGARRDLDALTTATWVSGYPSFFANRTHLSDVRALLPGEWVKLSPVGEDAQSWRGDVKRYWRPLVRDVRRPAAARVRERQQRLRNLLLHKLEADLDPEGCNLLTLSGGVDSSALLAMASGVLKFPTMTWSLVPSSSERTYAKELSYIDPLRKAFGVTRQWEQQTTSEALEDLVRKAPPIPFPVLHPALCSLVEISREASVRVMVGGEFADEICGARLSTPDWATGTTLWELLTSVGRWPFGWSAPARWIKGRVLNAVGRPYLVHPDRLPVFAPKALQDEYQAFIEIVRRWIISLPVAHRYMLTRHQSIDFAPQNWEACNYYGIRRSIPFLSREMIELSLECHPSELIGPDTKKLLRGALHHDVPHYNLYRRDKGDFGLRFDQIRRPISDLALTDDQFWGELEAIVSPSWRRSIVEQGWITLGDKYPLLYLQNLRKNLKPFGPIR